MSKLFPEYKAAWETDEHTELRNLARDVFGKILTPHQEKFAEQHHVDRDVWNHAGEAGLLGLDIPAEYGGGGGDFGHEAVVQDEIIYAKDAAFGFGVGSTIVPHYINVFGSVEQKQKWLPKLCSGEYVGAIAMTEPGTGSDLQAVSTKAIKDGDEYVINGSKIFITNGTLCDLLIIVVKTDPKEGAKGISLVVAETTDLPGFSRGRVLNKIGMHGQDTRELFFENVRIPTANLLGDQEGQGFYQLMMQLGRERLSIGLVAAAVCEAAVLEGIGYAKERHAFGREIIKFQNLRFELADCKAEALAARTLVDHGVTRLMAGTLDPSTASMIKMWSTDTQGRVVDRCLQVFGGYGYMMEYPIAQMFAASRVQRIYGGTNEIMKELVSRSL